MDHEAFRSLDPVTTLATTKCSCAMFDVTGGSEYVAAKYERHISPEPRVPSVTPAAQPSAPTPASAAGPDPIPSGEGATCPCGTWHHRYGPRGGGFLCPACRAAALGGRVA